MKSFVFYAMQQEPTAWDDFNGALKDVIAKIRRLVLVLLSCFAEPIVTPSNGCQLSNKFPDLQNSIMVVAMIRLEKMPL